MLRTSLKIISRQSVRAAVGTPRSIAVFQSGGGQGRFTPAGFTKRPCAVTSKGFASKFLFPEEQGTPQQHFDFLSLDSFERMTHNPNIWLPLPDPNDAPRIAYLYLVRMIMYLGHPNLSDEESAAYWDDFETALDPPSSEIGRARTCASICTSVIAHKLSSLPDDSPLRTSNPEIFVTLGYLVELRDAFLADRVGEGKGWEVTAEEVYGWSEFWSCAMEVLTQLGIQLDAAGFGVSDETPDEVWRLPIAAEAAKETR